MINHGNYFVVKPLLCKVGNSSQSLWKDLDDSKKKRFNGYVFGTTSLLSSLTSAILTRFCRLNINI